MFRHRFFLWTPFQLLAQRAKYAAPLFIKRYHGKQGIQEIARRHVIPPPPLSKFAAEAAAAPAHAEPLVRATATGARNPFVQDPAVAALPLPATRLLMICPNYFAVNDETFADNGFARRPFTESPAGREKAARIVADALHEHNGLVNALQECSVDLAVFAGLPDCPDGVFVNNILSVHRAPHEPPAIVLYPMAHASRRAELKRDDIFTWIGAQNPAATVIDLRGPEPYGGGGAAAGRRGEPSYSALEGTGSLVLDRRHRVAFAAISNRTYYLKLREFAEALGYKLIVFHATTDAHKALRRSPVYHTNVVLSIGATWAVVALDAIPAEAEREAVVAHFAATGRAVVAITISQVRAFCGNILEVTNTAGARLTVMSETARAAFTAKQRDMLGTIVAVPFSTIETYGGGGVRCCLAEI